MCSEMERIAFVKNQRSEEDFILWLKQTITVYEKALKEEHWTAYHKKFRLSIIALKKELNLVTNA